MMDKKSLSLILLSALLLAAFGPIAFAHNAPFPASYDATSAVVDTIGEPESVDPAFSYDTAGGGVIINVYETMTFFDNVMEGNGPYTAGQVDQFKPLLATAWAWTPGPAPYIKTLTFTVRSNVTFHDGTPFSAADVEYSWERLLVLDRDGGPAWMVYYPVLGVYGASSPEDDPNFGDNINNAFTSTANTVSIHLMTDYDQTRFLQIMSGPWAGVVEKAWAVAFDDFDGNWAAGWETIYHTWHNPASSYIEDHMMGTGPYKFDYWVHGTAYSVIKNDAYWDGWPARVRRAPAATNERIGGFLTRVTWNLLTSWTTRSFRFNAGDADFTYVPRSSKGSVLGGAVNGVPMQCYYPFQLLALDTLFLTYNINPQSPYLGPGFDPANPHTIAENRIPVDLFSDIHVRLAFAYITSYTGINSDAREGSQPSDPVVKGLPYDNPAQSSYTFDPAMARSELQLAWGGALWANGMSFTIPYGSGNDDLGTAMSTLTSDVNALNPKFHLTSQAVPWISTYLPRMNAGMLPLFTSGWTADYPDPDDFVFPFMHSQGKFSQLQGYSNARVDALVEAGALMPDDTLPYNGELDAADPRPLFNNYPNIPPDTRWARRSIYYELQAIYGEDVPGVSLVQWIGRHWQQGWVRGWYYNPLFGGSLTIATDSTAPEAPVTYFYHIWKMATHFGDANNDGAVNVVDGATISGSWTKPSPTSPLGPLGYKPQADLTGGTGGTSSGIGLILGIPDGKVNVQDAALVSAYWDGPPKGPSHP